MTTGAATQQIGKGYFSKAKSFPVLKQRREGKRRSDFEKGSDSELPPPHPTPPFLCPTQTFLTVFALSQSLHEKFNLIKADNNSERNIQNIQWCNSTTHTVNTHKHGIFLS